MADSFTPEQFEQINRFVDLINSGSGSLTQLQREELELARRTKEASMEMAAFNRQLSSSGFDFAKTMLSGKEGFSHFGESIRGASSAVGGIVQSFGKLGFVAGGLIKIIGDFAETALISNDNLMKGYQALSSFGDVANDGLRGLEQDLNAIGLVSGEYDKLVSILRPISTDLSAFGVGVTNGKDRLLSVISNLIGPDNELELSLSRIGYTTQEIREGVGSFISMQTRLGLTQGKTAGQLSTESYKYLVTMKALQEITGLTVADQQKIRDEQQADARFKLHLSQMDEKEAENLQQAMMVYQSMFGAQAANELKDRIVNFGDITTQGAAASYQRNNKEFELIMRAMKEGATSLPEIMSQIAKNTLTSLKPFERSFRLAAGTTDELGYNFGIVSGAIKGIKDPEKLKEAIKNIIDGYRNQDEQMTDNIKAEQNNRLARLTYDKLAAEAGKGLAAAFELLSRVTRMFAKALAKTIDFITKAVPGMSATNLYEEIFGKEDGNKNKSDVSSSLAGRAGRVRETDPSFYGNSDNKLLERMNKLRFKDRSENTGGGETDEALVSLAEKIQEKYPGIYFTAFNDRYHQDNPDVNPRSKHKKGKALDFAFPYNPNDEESTEIVKNLRLLGATSVSNEYKKRSGGWTGGHFHAEVARRGGMFSGSEAGYPVMLHGNESVWPERDLKNLLKDVQKTTLEQYKQELMSEIMPNSGNDNNGSIISDAFSQFGSKLDTLINEQRRTNNIQDEILMYTRA